MTLLAVFILSTLTNILVETIHIPSTVIGKINIRNLLPASVIPVNGTYKDSYLNITELASENGYDIEEYKVTTEDGYILGLHRLTTHNTTTFGIPVFLMHGLLDSSDSWLLQGPNALGYLLTNEGFDVWMGNARGNKYSATHTQLSANEEKFWKFSWEEIGVYDLPAIIDHVLTISKHESLYYVGHSQGTTSFFVMNSLKPQYTSKIKMMFALSPIAWLSHADSPALQHLSTLPTASLEIFQYFNTLKPTEFLYQLYGSACTVIATGCESIFEMLFGKNYFVSDAVLPVIIAHASSSSMLQFLHYWQLYKSGRFCRFDYGWIRNLFYYGQLSAPDYELNQVTAPVVLFSSGNDRLAHPADVGLLQSHLPNVLTSYYSKYFSHIDYMYAVVAKDAVYGKIIKHIQDYEKR